MYHFHPSQVAMITCVNCQHTFDGKYCPKCGAQHHVAKINITYLITEILKVFMLEKGIFLTIRDFLLYPGRSAGIYLYQNRKKYVSPLVFLLVTSLIYSVINKIFHVEDTIVVDMEINTHDHRSAKLTNDSMKWIQDNYGYANILMSIFIAFFIWIFFRKKQLNYFEILSAMCYFMGIGMLFFTFSALVKVIGGINTFTTGSILMLVYITVAIASIFKPVRFSYYIKALVAYLLGFLFFYIAFVFVYFSIYADA